MAKTMAEAAREQLKRADEPKAEPKEAPKKKKKTDPAEIFDSMTPQQQKELLMFGVFIVLVAFIPILLLVQTHLE